MWHCSLALHPSESEQTDERWREMCEQFVSEMWFAGETSVGAVPLGGDPPRPVHRRICPRARGGDAGGRGREQGQHPQRPPPGATSLPGARAALRAPVAGSAKARVGKRAPKHGEIAADRQRRRGVGERGEHQERSTRRRLERVVRACAGASRDESEFVARLREQGLQVRPRYAEGGTSRVTGYSVRLPAG